MAAGNVAAGVLAAALVAAFLTWAWIALARRWRVQDEPGARRLHAQPTPRGGGIALALGWWLALAGTLAWSAGDSVSPLPWLLLVTGGFLACGLLDDFFPLSAGVKLGLQLLVALFVFIPFLPADIRANLPLLGLICVALLYFVNAWNFMDGSNGMITLQALVIAVAVGTWPGQEAGLRLAALLLAGACAGFLPFNFPKARVFLGDSGSYLLGSAVFVLLLASCGAGVMTPVQALLLASVVLLDSALTLGRRMLRGRPFWRAHREHLYQYAVRKGHSHSRVALAYAAATLISWLLALCLWGQRSLIVTMTLLTLSWGCGAAAYWLLRRHWLSRRKHQMGGQG